MMQRDFARLIEIDRMVAANRGPAVSRLSTFGSLVLNGRDDEALRLAGKITPNMVAASPTVTVEEFCWAAPDLALVLVRTSRRQQATRVADAALATWDKSPGLRTPEDHFCRVRLQAAVGRHGAALAEFERAVDLGYRTTVDEWFVGIGDDPTLDALRDDPRFKAQMTRIRDDLARQRVEADAWRKG
jgi:hypothetical protein